LAFQSVPGVLTGAIFLLVSSLPAQVVIVDNSDPGFSTTGAWSASSSVEDAFGTEGLINTGGSGADTATWAADLPEAGWYDVYAWWIASTSFFRTQQAPYTINHKNGSDTILASQATGAAQWNYLGRYEFEAGTANQVSLSDDVPESNVFVSADAVRFERAGTFEAPVNPVVRTGSQEACNLCFGSILPGSHEDHPDSEYYIISDVPERFGTEGILYSTRETMPVQAPDYPPSPFDVQETNGFTSIDDNFDVFMFHISSPGDGSAPRRIVVYAQNNGANSVEISPVQKIVTDGIIGTVHEMESTLGEDFLNGAVDDFGLPDTITVPAGEGAVIGFSKKFSTFPAGTYKSQNVNCFGRLRAQVAGTDPDLDVFIAAIDTTSADVPPDVLSIKSSVESLVASNTGAEELESFDFDSSPPGCALRRSTGVFPQSTWRSDLITYDLNALPGGVTYQMGLDDIRTGGCPDMSQTVGALRYPRFLRDESIGNFMADHRVQFRVINSGTEPREFDLEFGKSDADIGLVYQLAEGESLPPDSAVNAETAVSEWAGPNQNAVFASFFPDSPQTLAPGEEIYIALRFQILGNSSTPFQIRIPDTRGPAFDRIAADPGAINPDEQTEIRFVATEPTLLQPAVTVNGNNAAPLSGRGNNYTFRYTARPDEAPGPATVLVEAADNENNAGSTSTTEALTILGNSQFDGWMFFGN